MLITHVGMWHLLERGTCHQRSVFRRGGGGVNRYWLLTREGSFIRLFTVVASSSADGLTFIL